MTTVEARGGPLDGRKFQVSVAAYRLLVRKPVKFQAEIEVLGIYDEKPGTVVRSGLYKIPEGETLIADYVGPE